LANSTTLRQSIWWGRDFGQKKQHQIPLRRMEVISYRQARPACPITTRNGLGIESPPEIT
jgi:hypothetical protein